MTEEEYFREHYPDVCYNGKPLSPYWDLFQDGVEFGERESEKRIEELERKLEQTENDLADYQFNYPKIKELEKENAELEEHIKADCIDCVDYIKNKKLEKENIVLKESNRHKTEVCKELAHQANTLQDQLTEAKEIIREIMKYDIPTLEYEKAEQFLQEIKNEYEL